AVNAPAVVIKDMQQAAALAKYITGEKDQSLFYEEFNNQYSPGFDPHHHLQNIGVVNQTTMLASDTQAIADHLKEMMIAKFGPENINEHFADTRDTLCYATNDNQSAVTGMLETKAELAVIVGGYNSSNTSHLVELCEKKLPSYFINDEGMIISQRDILHYDFHTKQEILTSNYLPHKVPARILITSGASCPDALVEGVITRLSRFYKESLPVAELVLQFK